MKFYLAGKVRGRKWAIVPDASKHDYVASDGYVRAGSLRYVYDNHGWQADDSDIQVGYWGKPHDDLHLVEQATGLIQECDALIAYVDCPTAFGTVAEVAYACALKKPVVAFYCVPHENDFLQSVMADAYRFTFALPGVTKVQVASPSDAAARVVEFDRLESPIEVRLAAAMSRHWIQWEPQSSIGKYRLDFAIESSRIAIECDGHDYHSTKQQRGYDAERDRFLLKEGWRVMRFTGSQIYQDADKCAREISELLRAQDAQQRIAA